MWSCKLRFKRVPFPHKVIRVVSLLEFVRNQRVSRTNGMPIAVSLAPNGATRKELFSRRRADRRRIVTIHVHAFFYKVLSHVRVHLRVYWVVRCQPGADGGILHVGRRVGCVDREHAILPVCVHANDDRGDMVDRTSKRHALTVSVDDHNIGFVAESEAPEQGQGRFSIK